jgi:hypothetical protein
MNNPFFEVKRCAQVYVRFHFFVLARDLTLNGEESFKA